MTTSRTETVTVADRSFDAHAVIPDSGSGPGLIVIQEIFGVNDYIRSVCERVAAMGYVALAPDMFWRLPSEDAQAVADRFAAADDADVLVQAGAGHAFDNDRNPMFSNPEAAKPAWEATAAFLARHLPVA